MATDLRSKFNDAHNPASRKLVHLLSNNSRLPISRISEQMKMGRGVMATVLKKLESDLKMSYTIELDSVKLGLVNPHLILVRFHRKPDYLDLVQTLSQSYVAQFAATIKGSYDMLIYANAYSLSDYLTWDMRMRALLMKKYRMEWETSDVSFNRIGYFPVRNEAIERASIKPRYRDMLKLLNMDSRIPLNHLSRILRMNYKTAIYAFDALMKEGYIKRFTVNLGIHDRISLMTLFNRFIPTSDYEGVEALVKEFYTSDDRLPLVNRSLLCSNLVGSYDFFTLGAYDDFKIGYKHGIELYSKLFKKYDITKTEYGEVKDVLIGKIPIRSVDVAKDFKHFHIPNI
ncbi:MAG: Lrp/AsnC family transcriptional regulator [Candidatus Micrarchaeota archaeon]|nr:Lrp/AsnC family transcriptional regulator [Candidatus Micrarchaeota archaeon]